jgi:hypothetical protein
MVAAGSPSEILNQTMTELGHRVHLLLKRCYEAALGAKFSGKPHISGTKGGHTINLHRFALDGVSLLGRLAGVRGGILTLAGCAAC